MKILALIMLLAIIATYLYAAYRLYKSPLRAQPADMIIIVMIPFWGCLIYLFLENRRIRNAAAFNRLNRSFR